MLVNQAHQPKFAPESRWKCPDCNTAGYLQYLPHYIERRTLELPDPPAMPDPPTGPMDWQAYLDEFFAEGVLFLGVLDEPGYPVRDTSAFILSDKVEVSLAPGRDPILEIPERWCGRRDGLVGVRRLTQDTPGVLIVHGPPGKAARLDAHLTEADKAYVHHWKHTDYTLVRHACGDDSCRFCVGIEPDR